MTEYENADGYISDKEVKRYFKEEAELGTTDDPDSALFVLRDGTMINSQDEWGDGREDHNIAIYITSEGEKTLGVHTDEDDNKVWGAVHAKTGMIRVVPETGEALIGEGQKLTPKQEEFVNNTGFKVDEYTKLYPPQKDQQKAYQAYLNQQVLER